MGPPGGGLEKGPPMKPIVSVDLVRAASLSDTFPMELLPRAEALAKDYEAFLSLVAEHGGPVAPTREIDEMWHLHMLHPVAYHGDCLRLFGAILDHDGGFGKRDGELPTLQRVHERTAELWFAKYGTPYGGTATKCWHDCASRCWHACSSKTSTCAGVDHAAE